MKKTLFIKIDNTPFPVEAENEVVPLDCKQINDFCSFAGDALVGDLKDNNGTPFYRLINPVGRLLSDFEKVDKANYDHIIAQWLDILGEMIHKGVAQCDEQFIIHFPQQYVDWLLCNENDYYVEIGKCLQSNDGKVYLDGNGVSEDIISVLHMKIRRFLNDNKDEIEYIVFSNERIGNSSYVVKQLKTVFDSYSFMRLEQWEQILQKEQQRRIENLEDVRSFWFDDLKLGVTTKDDIPQSDETYYKNFHLKFNKKGILSSIKPGGSGSESRDAIISILFGETKDSKDFDSYNSIVPFLIRNRGFYISKEPKNEWASGVSEYRFEAIIRKETDTFLCELSFLTFRKSYMCISDCKDLPGTLFDIVVEFK